MTWKRPWIKLWVEMLDDPKVVVALTPDQRWVWVALLLLGARSPQPGSLLLPSGEPMSLRQLWHATRAQDMPLNDFTTTIQMMERQGMVSWHSETLLISHWHARQDTQDATAAERKRRQRDRERQGKGHHVTAVTPAVTLGVTPLVTAVTGDVPSSPLTTPLERVRGPDTLGAPNVAPGLRTKAAQQPGERREIQSANLKDPGEAAAREDQTPARASGKTTAPKRAKTGGNPVVDAVLSEIRQLWGQPLASYGREAHETLEVLELGYTPEQIMACWRAAKGSVRWGNEWYPIRLLKEDIGDFVNNGGAPLRRWSWVPGQSRGATREEPLRDPEALRQAWEEGKRD
ncbi:MAG: phage replisome organizer N-terminal domain-containing protein [Chloroflexota bacterium]|nr:phage replisome organizer N-terminal domain-containing protein [Chloroflexota bacterium]